SSLATVGRLLFSEYVVPFEIASVLLLVALLGAVALSRRDDRAQAQSATPAGTMPAAGRKEGR
ncbi:MAG TPA: NADH-quinone oxidoreductase subunit J, partial [Limnochorda sp.]